jgi:hypothetical protein
MGADPVSILDHRELYDRRQGSTTAFLLHKNTKRAGPTGVVVHDLQVFVCLLMDATMLSNSIYSFSLSFHTVCHD